MRRPFLPLASLILVCVPALASAQGMQLTATAGVTRFLDEAQTGLGLDAFPGLSMGPVVLEAQLGYHRGEETLSLSSESHSTTYVPVLAGGRVGLPLGIFVPWLGAHGGFSHVARRTEYLGNVAYIDREWEPAMNAGAGIDVGAGKFRIGAAVWYDLVLDQDDPLRAVTGSLGLTIGL